MLLTVVENRQDKVYSLDKALMQFFAHYCLSAKVNDRKVMVGYIMSPVSVCVCV